MNKIFLALGFLAFVVAGWLLAGSPGKQDSGSVAPGSAIELKTDGKSASSLNAASGSTDLTGGASVMTNQVVPATETGAETGAGEESAGTVKETDPVIITEKTMSDGLKVEVLAEGTGDRATKAGDAISVHYTGTLTDGTKFDSSVDRGTPFQFTLGAGMVIAGWDQGLLDMKVGEKRRLTIPASLGYGERGAGSVIPPNATLVFETELMAIE
jgi:FKBP-type peptidyl-prolyl cis-trans isomerase